MIVAMRHLDLVCLASDREETLRRLRELGAVHLDLNQAEGAGVVAAVEELALAEKAVRLIRQSRVKGEAYDLRPRTVAETLAIDADRATLKSEQERLVREIKYFEPWGDFDPDLAKRLLARGLAIAEKLPPRLPEMRLGKLQEKLARVENRIRIDTDRLAGTDENAILSRYPRLKDDLSFAQAQELLSEHGRLSAVSGWVPEPKVAALSATASQSGWALLLREPCAGENPPTLIEPPRFFKSVKVLFEGLGIAPAYAEGDVSVAFLAYFSIFFAMLVGDGAYGSVFLGLTCLGWWKTRKSRSALVKSWLILLTVFSSATIVWGVLSDTWFGANVLSCVGADGVRVARWGFAQPLLTPIGWLADPSYQNMMLLCFTIGVSHLMLARLWNGVLRINSLDCLPEFGWAGVLLFMYLVTNQVVGIFSTIPTWGFWMFGVSFLLIVSRTRGAALGMLPLNVMSALGDIISYVRLFAVGLASVKVAENFNMMATGLVAGDDVWWLKALMSVAMVLILCVGHLLNLAMAGLSILVHAVRLNTLEFSNHKGISWSGYAFRPFRRSN